MKLGTSLSNHTLSRNFKLKLPSEKRRNLFSSPVTQCLERIFLHDVEKNRASAKNVTFYTEIST